MEQTNFGRWVHSTRTGKNLSIRECAERMGVSAAYWSRIEQEGFDSAFDAASNLRRSTIERFAVGLDVPSDEAFLAAGLQSSVRAVKNRQQNLEAATRKLALYTQFSREDGLSAEARDRLINQLEVKHRNRMETGE